MKLSSTQLWTLRKFADDEWRSAYDVQASMATLKALVKRGMLRRDASMIGAIWSPRTSILY